ncbi:hypothetical protein CEUSTIGMA_g5826.t1 [Chlamydomonas eustigma]|uniref:16S rRNA (uracil(1498)-N(3))-methyltransferase n=1 Tax=Chlamydomonas eustigma TaxID=1157962 RepID=A0A250X5L6_9CHLO|nr:hypothetical protein CEUSTIGMA_g5826.t1 [Chlamydomonas eustigma]|eukprot:GAX78384.1 hypothetical protein CEUSTIGMA_g5826.t1 [Chlamydomonas eustigma]
MMRENTISLRAILHQLYKLMHQSLLHSKLSNVCVLPLKNGSTLSCNRILLQNTRRIQSWNALKEDRTIANDDLFHDIKISQDAASSRLHRFYTSERLFHPPSSSISSISAPKILSGLTQTTFLIEGDEARHALRALRLSEGDEVDLCDGNGGIARCAVSALDKRRGKAWLVPVSEPQYHDWVGPELVLVVACLTLKGGRAEWLVEKATEIGAREFIPIATERSAVPAVSSKFGTLSRSKSKDYFHKEGRKPGSSSAAASSKKLGNQYESDENDDGGDGELQASRLERVSIAATKQSLRAHSLKIWQPTPLLDVLDLVKGADVALLAAAGGAPMWEVSERLKTTSRGCISLITPRLMQDAENSITITSDDDAAFGRHSVASYDDDSKTVNVSHGDDDGSKTGNVSHGDDDVRKNDSDSSATRLSQASLAVEACCNDEDCGSDVKLKSAQSDGTIMPDDRKSGKRVLIVGPEGDFTPEEVKLLVEAGAIPTGLGPNRLRTETAAIMMLSACMMLPPSHDS